MEIATGDLIRDLELQEARRLGCVYAQLEPERAKALARRILLGETEAEPTDFEVGVACGISGTIGLRECSDRHAAHEPKPSTPKGRVVAMKTVGKPSPDGLLALGEFVAQELIGRARPTKGTGSI